MAPQPHPWGGRTGPAGAAGFSKFAAPSLSSELGPFVTRVSGIHVPLIDADGYIYLTTQDAISKLSDEGYCLWKVKLSKERGSMAGTPALFDGAVLAYTDKGEAVSLDMRNGRERWRRVFCAGGCVLDINNVAAGGGIMIVPGKERSDHADLAFNTDVYALDASTGNEKWKVKVMLGVMCFSPAIAENSVVFQTINGEVACHNLKDGTKEWMSKRMGMSTGGAVFCKETGLVYSTANRRAKTSWNAPYGGSGSARAFDLKTGEIKWNTDLDLEVNALPAVAPVGPEGRMIVITPMGANPGTVANPTGDTFPAKVLALDARDGTPVWESETWFFLGSVLNTQVAFTSPVASANGSIFIGWFNNQMFELDGASGATRAQLSDGLGFTNGLALGPNMLAFQTADFLFTFRSQPRKCGRILRDSGVPLAETGFEHFWPQAARSTRHGGHSPLPAPTDLAAPSWAAGDIEKHFARSPGLDFYHTTPAIDSQRNLYISTEASRILIIRPDGNLRGYVDCGDVVSGVCLHDRYLYACNGAGYCWKVDLETLEVAWNRRVCQRCPRGSWSPALCEAQGLLLVAGCKEGEDSLNGGSIMVAVRTSDGSKAWSRVFFGLLLNLFPCIWEEKNVLFVSDFSGGLYCMRINNGTSVWEHQPLCEDAEGSITKGHCVSAPNGMIYSVWNLQGETPGGVWNKGAGSGGVLRAYDMESGDHRWTHRFPLECHVAPAVVPSGGGHVVVVAQGSHGAAPDGDPALPSGDAWESAVCGLDGASGEELWRFSPPPWRRYEARGSYAGDVLPAACFGSPMGDGNGNVYLVHWSGTVYCLEVRTGKVVSQADVGCASCSAVVSMPGTLLVPTGYAVRAYRDAAREREWLEAARAAGDGRADPRLWGPGKCEATEDDAELLTALLRVRPGGGEFPRTEYQDCPPPSKAHSQETHDARRARLAAAAAPPPPGGAPPAAAPRPAPSPAAAAGPAGPEAEAAGGPRLWVVVGGRAGGITVRKHIGLKSAELGRLSNGARVKEVDLQGDRLHYQKVSGDGPESGWVSLSFKGSELVKRA